jgi:glyoxylase-like metal-dependent hydrolase (beta-lactamase superfamily II)
MGFDHQKERTMASLAPLQTVTVGDIRVTYLPDGGGNLQATALYPGTTVEAWRPYAHFLSPEGGVVTTIGGYYIESGDHRVIVDTGLGPVHLDFPGFGPMDGGDYLKNVAAAGISPEAVTDVVFTHMHLDHVGWTTLPNNGGRKLLFPHARYMVTRTEWESWRDSDNPAGPHPETVQKPIADLLEFIAGGDDVAPGISVVETPGHTFGHVSLIVASSGQRLILTADLFHCPVQVEERDWSVAFDMDVAAARASRERMYPELCKLNTLAAVNHFSNQVFGRFSRHGDGYRWTPLGG